MQEELLDPVLWFHRPHYHMDILDGVVYMSAPKIVIVCADLPLFFSALLNLLYSQNSASPRCIPTWILVGAVRAAGSSAPPGTMLLLQLPTSVAYFDTEHKKGILILYRASLKNCGKFLPGRACQAVA